MAKPLSQIIDVFETTLKDLDSYRTQAEQDAQVLKEQMAELATRQNQLTMDRARAANISKRIKKLIG